jgi:hypothetical protein
VDKSGCAKPRPFPRLHKFPAKIKSKEFFKIIFGVKISFISQPQVEAGGWPPEVQTAEQKRQFIEEYKKREGICLDPEKMVYNKGMYEVA